jgi:hypothetical protein
MEQRSFSPIEWPVAGVKPTIGCLSKRVSELQKVADCRRMSGRNDGAE